VVQVFSLCKFAVGGAHSNHRNMKCRFTL